MNYHNVFHGWNTMQKMQYRSKCYKGSDPPNPNDPSQISPVEFAQTRAAIMNYNQYVKDKPLMNAYAADIGKDPSITAKALAGQAGADLAQKNKMPTNINPNMGLPSYSKGALIGGKIMGDLSRDSISQKAAATQGILNNKLGLQSSVNTAQEGIAKDAVTRNLADSATEYNAQGNTKSAVSSAILGGASMWYNKEKPKTVGLGG